mgnify:CR=1 FL=1
MDNNVDLMLNQPEFMNKSLIKDYNHNQAKSHWQTLFPIVILHETVLWYLPIDLKHVSHTSIKMINLLQQQWMIHTASNNILRKESGKYKRNIYKAWFHSTKNSINSESLIIMPPEWPNRRR